VPNASTSAARKAAVSAAQIDFAIMDFSGPEFVGHNMERRKRGKVALAQP
jgi:hypothetical protein